MSSSSWYPNCGVCCTRPELPTCVVFVDDFDTDPLNARWNQAAGVWEQPAGSGYLRTASANAQIWSSYFPTYPLAGYRKIRAAVYGFEIGDTARIYPRYQNSSNYTAVEIVFGAAGFNHGQLRIVERISGIDYISYCETEHADRFGWIYVEVCQWQGNHTTAKINSAAGELLAFAISYTTGPAGEGSCGLGTGSQVTNDVRFDLYEEIHTQTFPDWDHCPTCPPLPWCTTGVSGRSAFYNGLNPENWLVNIGGVIADACPTADCDRMNSGFVVPGACGGSLRVDEGTNWCTGWLEYMPYFDVILAAEVWGASGAKITVTLREWARNGALTSRDIAVFERIYADFVRAPDIVNEAMTRTAQTSYLCNGSAATCNITALMP